ncbi:dienelactone hydrolase [Geitlerinema sp. CS-897]|nr:dienelactone hydrolase [Geitlerinema sp. CS-897]
MTVRAIYEAAKIESAASPYDTLNLKIFYPACLPDDERSQNLGIVPADDKNAPFPVVIFFNGINCSPEVYQWLAVKLAERKFVVVTFSWVAENIPGMVALTPGVDIKMLSPQLYGTGPTASALPTILKTLEQLQNKGILAGLLDLNRIVLGGHSAGGRVAIESASPQFFSQVVASFAYGAHTAAAVQIGYEPGTILPLPDELPLLLIGGTCDGVIAQSSHRYGVTWEQPTTPIQRTFQDAIAGGRNDSYLLLLEGANHFSIAQTFDSTTGRPFLDFPETQPQEQLQNVMVEAIALFLEARVKSQPEAIAALERLTTANREAIATFERK